MSVSNSSKSRPYFKMFHLSGAFLSTSITFTLSSSPTIQRQPADQVRWWRHSTVLTALWRLSYCKMILGKVSVLFVCGLPCLPQGHILIQWHEYICTTLNSSPVSFSNPTAHLLLMSQTKALHFAKFYSSQPRSELVKSPQGPNCGTKT